MKVAVVGCTGLVGTEMLKVLEEEKFPVSELIPVASPNSIGKKIKFQGKEWTIVSMEDAISRKPELAIFSAGSGPSKEFAPQFAAVGTVVVDNSSCWRMDPGVPLIVPEINLDVVQGHKIIANPNCSTIQMVMALAPLHKRFGIKRIVVSTYQSVTGTGVAAVQQMKDERAGIEGKKVYSEVIDMNCIPHCDVFLDNDYTKEEMKLVNETRKILRDNDLKITATAVRVPVVGGHSESVNVEFKNPYTMEEVRKLLKEMPGVILQDDPSKNLYPTPLKSQGKNEVFVGRLRRDESLENGLNLWVVSDNIRKGAATNAIQIAQGIFLKNKVLK